MKKVISSLLIASSCLFGYTDIYLAGPLFTMAERQFNTALADQLRSLGYTIFLPQEEEPREFTAAAIFENDIQGIDQSRIVVAIMDGSDPDSGACFECGYAYAKGKPIIAVRTDFRGIGDGDLAPYNLMLTESATKRVSLSSLQCNLDTLVKEIDLHLRDIVKNELLFKSEPKRF